jgi:DnaJ-class molecular chaperone
MKYKIEIIAGSMSELVTQLRITFMELASPRSGDFIADIESKGMESCFFTKYATITTIEEIKDCGECEGTGLTGVLDCPECGGDGVTR